MAKDEAMEVDSETVAKDSEEAPVKDLESINLEKLREHCRLIERGDVQKESSHLARVLRALVTTRKSLDESVLGKLLALVFVPASAAPARDQLLAYVKTNASSSQMEVDGKKPAASSSKSPRSVRKVPSGQSSTALLPEVELYVHLLVLLFLIDNKRKEETMSCVEILMKKLEGQQHRRTMDPLAAKIYFYYSLVMEREGKLSEIRKYLHQRLRAATLSHEEECQATLINCLLRSYLLDQLYLPAEKLVAKISFPESANNNEYARHYYYLGAISAMRCEYGKAQSDLRQAIRKAPQHTAIGFKQRVKKLAVVVDLLLGEIPERSLFRQPVFKKSLSKYLTLTQSVRIGDVAKFNEVLEANRNEFEADGTYSLIVRLRQNVIKTAVKTICKAYTRISFKSVQQKLQLTHPDDAEYIVSKAIKDGVIEASVNHEEGYMQSKETENVYGTTEPQQQFDRRTAFCLKLYNQAVKAMRFPPKSYQEDLETAEEKREREQQELEIAKELLEEDEDFP